MMMLLLTSLNLWHRFAEPAAIRCNLLLISKAPGTTQGGGGDTPQASLII